MRWFLPGGNFWTAVKGGEPNRAWQSCWVEGKQRPEFREAEEMRALESSPNVHWRSLTNTEFDNVKSTISSIQSNTTPHREMGTCDPYQEKTQSSLSFLANLEGQIYLPAWNNQNADKWYKHFARYSINMHKKGQWSLRTREQCESYWALPWETSQSSGAGRENEGRAQLTCWIEEMELQVQREQGG